MNSLKPALAALTCSAMTAALVSRPLQPQASVRTIVLWALTVLAVQFAVSIAAAAVAIFFSGLPRSEISATVILRFATAGLWLGPLGLVIDSGRWWSVVAACCFGAGTALLFHRLVWRDPTSETSRPW